MKRLVNITHTDTDGIGCGVITKYFANRYGMSHEVTYCGYGTITEEVKKILEELEEPDHNIGMFIISDISVREDTNVHVLIDRAAAANPDVVIRLLDHHGTADWLNAYDWAEVHEYDKEGVKRCGTWWVYKFLSEYFEDYLPTRKKELDTMAEVIDNPQPLNVDPVVDYVMGVDLYDTWKWVEDYPEGKPYELAGDLDRLLKIKGSEEMAKAILEKLEGIPVYRSLHGYTTSLLDATDETLIYFKVLEIQRAIKQKEQQLLIGEYKFKVGSLKQFNLLKKHFISKYPTNTTKLFKALNKWNVGASCLFKVGVVYCSDYMSEIGNALARNHPELDFIIMVTLPGNISCRCTKDLPVPLGVIANAIGQGAGGGHEKSAGTPIKFKNSKDLLENLIKGLDLSF